MHPKLTVSVSENDSKGDRRLPAFPHVATLCEAGYDVVAESHNGIGAPAGLDPRILSILDCAAKKAVMDPEFKKASDKIRTMVKYLSSNGFRQYVLSDYLKLAHLIRDLKLKEQLGAG